MAVSELRSKCGMQIGNSFDQNLYMGALLSVRALVAL